MKIHRNDSTKIFEDIKTEVQRSKELHQERFNSIPELMGVLREEYLEIEHRIMETKKNVPPPEELTELHKELVQLAAVCAKGIESFCICGIEDGKHCFGEFQLFSRACYICSERGECKIESNKGEEEG